MKHPLVIYIETADINKLKDKASHAGFNGKGAVSHYIIKVAREQICFITTDVQELLKQIKKGK